MTGEGTENSAITNILGQLANFVRFDQAQALTAAEALQARENIGAVSEADVAAAISAAFTDEDLAASYSASAAPTAPAAATPASSTAGSATAPTA